MSDIRGGRYLGVPDLDGAHWPVTVSAWELILEEKEYDGRNYTKKTIVLHFSGQREGGKGLKLNKVNEEFMIEHFGDETDGWVGASIILYIDPSVSFKGRMTGGIRLKLPAQGADIQPSPQPARQQNVPPEAQPPMLPPDDPPF